MNNNQIIDRLDLFRRDIQHLKTRLGKISYSQGHQDKMTPEVLSELHRIRSIFRDGSYDIFSRQRDMGMDVVEIKSEFSDLPVTSILCEASETIENLYSWAKSAMSDAQKGDDSGYIAVCINDVKEELSAICNGLRDFIKNKSSKQPNEKSNRDPWKYYPQANNKIIKDREPGKNKKPKPYSKITAELKVIYPDKKFTQNAVREHYNSNLKKKSD